MANFNVGNFFQDLGLGALKAVCFPVYGTIDTIAKGAWGDWQGAFESGAETLCPISIGQAANTIERFANGDIPGGVQNAMKIFSPGTLVPVDPVSNAIDGAISNLGKQGTQAIIDGINKNKQVAANPALQPKKEDPVSEEEQKIVEKDEARDITNQQANTARKADKMYEDVMRRFEAHKAYFEKEVDNFSSEIEAQVKSINSSKETIKTELFPAFAEKMKKLKDITVSDEYLKEYFSGTTLKVDSMKSKADLYLIDFKKNPFKSNSLAIVTLGFYTRKKAKETLERVKEEKKRLEEEMARMDSELVKLRNIKQALELIAEYYLSLIELYRALLNRLDNSVNFLMIRCISFAHKLVREQMSIKLLPKSQQAEIMAMVSISKVLKSMVDKNITMEGKTEKISSNVAAVKEEMRKQKEEIKKLNEAA